MFLIFEVIPVDFYLRMLQVTYKRSILIVLLYKNYEYNRRQTC